jgi:hypothetical protein
MSEAAWLGGAGCVGALIAFGVLEWLSPAIEAELPPERSASPMEAPVNPGLHQCQMNRLTVEAESVTYEARLAVLELSISLAKPDRPNDAPIQWPEELIRSDWPGRVSREAGGWVSAIPSAHIHEIDCDEMPCLALVSWEQEPKGVVDIGGLLSEHVSESVIATAPFGRFVEPMTDERIAVLSVVAFSPIDLLTEWPVRIDERAARLMNRSEDTWAADRPRAVEPEVEPMGHGHEDHEGHQH